MVAMYPSIHPSIHDSLPSCAKGRIKRDRNTATLQIQQRLAVIGRGLYALDSSPSYPPLPLLTRAMLAFPTTTELLVPNTYTTANIIPLELVYQHVNNLLQANQRIAEARYLKSSCNMSLMSYYFCSTMSNTTTH